MALVPPRTWVLLSDKQGDNGQVETIVAALPWPVERKYVHMLHQWVLGKPRYRPSLDHIDPAKSDPIEGPWPDLILTVADTGPGMDEEFIPRAFERFTRPDDSRTATTGGGGLGLALVRAIATAAGGTATLANSHPGLTVTVTLPTM